MKKYLSLIAWVICCALTHGFGQLKIDMTRFISLYNEGRYKEVFDEAYELRNKKEFGKMAVLDYFMAKALCGEGSYEAASRGFQFILTEYPLTKNQKKFVLDEFDVCRKAEVATASDQEFLLADFKLVSGPNIPIAKVSGKLGYVLDCKSDPEAYKFMPDFDRRELQKRLFMIDEKENAKAYYKNYLGNTYNVNASGRYVFITQKPYNLSSAKIKYVTDNLEKAYGFLHNFYNIRPPDKLIAVYLMRDKETLRATAKKIHGLTLPESNIGYSGLDDLSILGTSDADHIGTIYHELFHLMIRTDVGDIPAWLDEGIACLYETSTWKNETLKGNTVNWRTQVLQENLKAGNQLPKLKTIINGNWDGFLLNENNSPCDVAYNYAVVKHFAIYMQQHGLLEKMMLAFKERKNVFTDTLSKNESSMTLVEKATGMKIDSLQNSFDQWMNITYKIKPGAQYGPSLETRFRRSFEMLMIYKRGGFDDLVNSEKYKQLEQNYLTISKELDGLKRSPNPNAVEQYSLSAITPESLNKKMKKFIEDVAVIIREYPLG